MSVLTLLSVCITDGDIEDASAKEDAHWPSCILNRYTLPGPVRPQASSSQITTPHAGKRAPHFTFTFKAQLAY